MQPRSEIRRLARSDAEDSRAIRLQALPLSPDAVGSVYEIERARPLAAFADRLEAAVALGAYRGETIVGSIGFRREDGPKG